MRMVTTWLVALMMAGYVYIYTYKCNADMAWEWPAHLLHGTSAWLGMIDAIPVAAGATSLFTHTMSGWQPEITA